MTTTGTDNTVIMWQDIKCEAVVITACSGQEIIIEQRDNVIHIKAANMKEFIKNLKEAENKSYEL